jgi:acetoin utilization deacetylase AcuC-like enzyme
VPRFVYSSDYQCDIGAHVFRTDKYALLHQLMLDRGLAEPGDFIEPQPARPEDLELVHTPAYVDDLLSFSHTQRTLRSEMPISEEIVRAFILGAGGSILACRLALEHGGQTMNLAGGFHHAFPDWAEGFCYINDVAVGVARVRADGLADRVMVVDCDLHQGNGTAVIFQDVPEVFTFSIHEEAIYPMKRQSDMDIGLPFCCPGDVYVEALESRLTPLMDKHQPEFVFYVAGADPFEKDILGSLALSLEDMKRRDEIVLGACAERGIPAAAALAGGYSAYVEDTVEVHFGTAQTIVEMNQRYAPV